MALQQSMNDVNAEMAELGQLTPAPATPASTPVLPEPLQRIVSFTYSGSLDQGVAKLAQSVGYTFYVTAPPNAQPVAQVCRDRGDDRIERVPHDVLVRGDVRADRRVPLGDE